MRVFVIEVFKFDVGNTLFAKAIARCTMADKDANFPLADSKDSDQTARMCRLIRLFSGNTYQNVRFLTMRVNCAMPRLRYCWAYVDMKAHFTLRICAF